MAVALPVPPADAPGEEDMVSLPQGVSIGPHYRSMACLIARRLFPPLELYVSIYRSHGIAILNFTASRPVTLAAWTPSL